MYPKCAWGTCTFNGLYPVERAGFPLKVSKGTTNRGAKGARRTTSRHGVRHCRALHPSTFVCVTLHGKHARSMDCNPLNVHVLR
jgi:hypothetical protein